ncbi:MAG: dihydrofolate reductase family protein [Candidatus Krumholzibacteria bacterium]|nr:dihydrofolate reductase family protein [Candidatus Krumholzibacteria bacterium]MDH4337528.1 dihydrofolate reductase family protein [Candidatus Krumholzibacteria bacterium]MDH5269945.1 dihydrofolate reductase family protein [Candidatus Krumholzibacteria bacterium]
MPKRNAATVSVNMAVSVDGRITTRTREHFALGSENDRRLMDELRAAADAVIVGAGTVRHDGWPMLIRYADLREKRVAAGRSPHPVNVVLSRALDLPIRARFFQTDQTERIVFTTRQAPVARVKRFGSVADVVVLPGRRLSPAAIVSQLHARGLRGLLLEGGGEVHFAFAEANLVDRLYVTITPRLIGGMGAPSLLDGKGFLQDSHQHLKLESLRREGDEIFLCYRVLHRRRDR